MEQANIRRLKSGTLDHFRTIARENGRSLEAELRHLLESHPPLQSKRREVLLRLSDEALAMTPPIGPANASDSTLLIRWDRDTDHGHDLDDGWTDDDARH
jgi:plasmid stability protein